MKPKLLTICAATIFFGCMSTTKETETQTPISAPVMVPAPAVVEVPPPTTVTHQTTTTWPSQGIVEKHTTTTTTVPMVTAPDVP